MAKLRDEDHFVVLEGIENDIVYLNDPAMGRRQLPWKEFRTSYTGVYIEVRPDKEKFVPEGHPYSIVKALAEKLSEDKWAGLFILILGLCMIIPGLAVPVMSQIFIDDIFSMKHPDWTKNLFAAMFGAMVLSGVMTAMRSAVLELLAQETPSQDSAISRSVLSTTCWASLAKTNHNENNSRKNDFITAS